MGIFMWLLGTALFSMKMRIWILFGHTDTLSSIHSIIKPLRNPSSLVILKSFQLSFSQAETQLITGKIRLKEQILIYGICSLNKFGSSFINRYLSLENNFLCRDSYVFSYKCHIKGFFVQVNLYFTFREETKKWRFITKNPKCSRLLC